jgi:hypothetical protein
MTFIIVGMILYFVLQNKKTEINQLEQQRSDQISDFAVPSSAIDPNDGTVASPEMRGNFVEKSLSKVLVNILKTPEGRAFLEKTIRPAQDPVSGTQYTIKSNNALVLNELFKIKTTVEGSGPKASCGHFVRVNYKITDSHNHIMDSGINKSLHLGEMEIIPALDSIISGMKIGEKRTAVIHQKYAYGAPNFRGNKPHKLAEYYLADITLLDIKPDNFTDDSVKIFDDEIAYAIPCLCGDFIEFNAKISEVSGKVIFDSRKANKKTSMTLGNSAYPMIFSHALFNKIPVGTRTVICKGSHLRSLASEKMSTIFPKEQPKSDEFYLIEFSDLSIAQHR